MHEQHMSYVNGSYVSIHEAYQNPDNIFPAQSLMGTVERAGSDRPPDCSSQKEVLELVELEYVHKTHAK